MTRRAAALAGAPVCAAEAGGGVRFGPRLGVDHAQQGDQLRDLVAAESSADPDHRAVPPREPGGGDRIAQSQPQPAATDTPLPAVAGGACLLRSNYGWGGYSCGCGSTSRVTLTSASMCDNMGVLPKSAGEHHLAPGTGAAVGHGERPPRARRARGGRGEGERCSAGGDGPRLRGLRSGLAVAGLGGVGIFLRALRSS